MPPHLWYNPPVPIPRRLTAIALATTALLTACLPGMTQVTPTASITLAPYRTPTSMPTPARPTATLPPIVTPGPSPTPLTHLVQANDTLLGIAVRYGVALEDLLAANPGVNPRFLSIGQAVVIPGPEGQPVPALAPTPTPVSAVIYPARCFRTLSESLWCLALVGNPLDVPIEGVTALVALLDGEGRVLESQVAHTPLRQVPPGTQMPVAAWFAPPAPRPASSSVMLLSAMVGGSPSRTLPLRVELDTNRPAQDHLSWTVSGEVSLDGSSPVAASRVTVVAFAYDSSGSAAGFAVRDWEEPLVPGGSRSFDITVYSLGPAVERVEVLAEALLAE